VDSGAAARFSASAKPAHGDHVTSSRSASLPSLRGFLTVPSDRWCRGARPALPSMAPAPRLSGATRPARWAPSVLDWCV
jgi:hypothetical protein